MKKKFEGENSGSKGKRLYMPTGDLNLRFLKIKCTV